MLPLAAARTAPASSVLKSRCQRDALDVQSLIAASLA